MVFSAVAVCVGDLGGIWVAKCGENRVGKSFVGQIELAVEREPTKKKKKTHKWLSINKSKHTGTSSCRMSKD